MERGAGVCGNATQEQLDRFIASIVPELMPLAAVPRVHRHADGGGRVLLMVSLRAGYCVVHAGLVKLTVVSR